MFKKTAVVVSSDSDGNFTKAGKPKSAGAANREVAKLREAEPEQDHTVVSSDIVK
ncbi:hypothetical protein ACFQS3_02490 [Glycomyces mayteni]|uniref:Uncharacterized protein n=1 Tax=Glycomyces mayteni TaxID=543887 RepID=A0ABW2D4Q7_9ACTN|nr:hypothetical protein GCM10025732_47970 [Glycomyces mayteni]